MSTVKPNAPHLAAVNTATPPPDDIASWVAAAAHIFHTTGIDVRPCLGEATPADVRAALGVVA